MSIEIIHWVVPMVMCAGMAILRTMYQDQRKRADLAEDAMVKLMDENDSLQLKVFVLQYELEAAGVSV